MIEAHRTQPDRLGADDGALDAVLVALAEIAHLGTRAARVPRSLWRDRAMTWRFSGRTWAGPAHDGRDRPRR